MSEVIIDDKLHGVRVVKNDLPVIMAPCARGKGKGEVRTTDEDNKNGICECAVSRCLVNGRNQVLREADEQYRIEYIN